MALRWSAQLSGGALQWGAHFDSTSGAPSAPASVAGSAISGTSANSTWLDTSGDETGFRVELSTDDGATWSVAGTVGAGVQTFVHTGLTPATAYRTGVAALGAGMDSERTVSAAWATDNTGSGGGDLGQGDTSLVTAAIIFKARAESRIYAQRA